MITSLLLAMFIACGGTVIDRAPGKVLACGETRELATGGSGAACEWVKVTR
jgi:hypothetical protein